MYRIICESYQNYIKNFNESDARYGASEPLSLITDVNKFNEERDKNSNAYQNLCDTLYYASQNVDKYPQMEAFLWTVASRGMTPIYCGVTDAAVLDEQVCLINSFLKLTYWQ